VLKLRLTHAELEFWVDVRLREFDDKWLAVADLADEPDAGTGVEPREALMALGCRLATELAAGADIPRDPHEDVIVTDHSMAAGLQLGIGLPALASGVHLGRAVRCRIRVSAFRVGSFRPVRRAQVRHEEHGLGLI